MARCQFERCRFAGQWVDVDGRHPRFLCDGHVGALQRAIDRPDTFRIGWGLSTSDKIDRDEQSLAALLNEFPDEPPMVLIHDHEDVVAQERWQATTEAWERIRRLQEALAGLRDDLANEGDRPATVRIAIRT